MTNEDLLVDAELNDQELEDISGGSTTLGTIANIIGAFINALLPKKD